MDVILKPLKNAYRYIMRGAPLKPQREVQEVLISLQIMPRHLNTLYYVFSKLKQSEKDHMTITTASEVSTKSLIKMVPHRKKWVERCLLRLVEFGGCYETMEWNQFLYIFLRFNSLSKVELCQAMFYIIIKDVKSWTIHYLTCSQLQEYYEFYKESPVKSFNTKDIWFARLPLHRYYISDFVELCHRYSQLINPLVHLQRCLQNTLPSMSFWNDYDRVETFNRRINLEFFRINRANVFLRGNPAFTETSDMLIPDTLGGERINLDQWKKRLGHYNHKEGVWPDFDNQKKSKDVIWLEDQDRIVPDGANVDLGLIHGVPMDSAYMNPAQKQAMVASG